MISSSGTETLFLIVGGAALLLWGARMVRTGMTRAFGGEIRQLLQTANGNRFVAAGTGFGAALMVQSATAVAALVMSFAGAGVLTVTGGLAAMLGADLGSAIVVQILSLNIKEAWSVLMFAGFVLHNVFQTRNLILKQIGRISLGLGMLMLALTVLGSAAGSLQQSDLIRQIMSSLGSEPVLTVLVAMLLTWLAHSSLAVILIVVGLDVAGVLGHGNLAVVLILGINAGASLPALMLSLSEGEDGKRIALGNFLFRFGGACLAVFLIDLWMPTFASFGLAAGERLIALHVALNLALLCLLLPCVGVFASLLAQLVSARNPEDGELQTPVLDESALAVPKVALSLASREVLQMLHVVETMLEKTQVALTENDAKLCRQISILDDKVDTLYRGVKFYLTELTRTELDEMEATRAFDIITFTSQIENAGDVIDRSLLDTVEKKIASKNEFSEQGKDEIVAAFSFVRETLRLSSVAFMQDSLEEARTMIQRKERYREIELEGTVGHLERLKSGNRNTIETSGYHLDILRDLKRINSHFASVGYSTLEMSDALRQSRLK